jgi:LacI family transcriptional regulator
MPKNASVTIRDVANRAGVSVATVSRYLNRNAPVSSQTATRLERVMEELNYVPSATARKLATNKTHTLGFICPDMRGDFFSPLLSGVESVSSAAGFDLLISSARRPQSSQGFPSPLGYHNTDGLLVFADGLDVDGLERFVERRFPMVLIHRTPPRHLSIPCVTVENKAASRNIVEHLIESHGYRRIAFLRGPQEQEDAYWREMGYLEALESHGIPFDPTLVSAGEFNREVACQSIQNMLAAGIEFDAVFPSDDESAVGVLAALNSMGKRVPEDIAVVGFDDERMSPYLNPPLTTVRAPTEEVGRVAAQQLVSLIQTGQADELTLLPTEIVIRRSCGCNG